MEGIKSWLKDYGKFLGACRRSFLWLAAALLLLGIQQVWTGPGLLLSVMGGKRPDTVLWTAALGLLLAALAGALLFCRSWMKAGKVRPGQAAAAAALAVAAVLVFAVLAGLLGKGILFLAGGQTEKAKRMTDLLAGLLAIPVKIWMLRRVAALGSGKHPGDRGKKGSLMPVILWTALGYMGDVLLTAAGITVAGKAIQCLYGTGITWLCITTAFYGYEETETEKQGEDRR